MVRPGIRTLHTGRPSPRGRGSYTNAAVDEFDASGLERSVKRDKRPFKGPGGGPPLKICDRSLRHAGALPEIGLRPIEEAARGAALRRAHLKRAIKYD
jgi:hypothetical protein